MNRFESFLAQQFEDYMTYRGQLGYDTANLRWALKTVDRYGCDGRTVHTTIVKGQIIMENREVLTLNADKLYAEVQEIAPNLVRRAGLKPQPRWPVQ